MPRGTWISSICSVGFHLTVHSLVRSHPLKDKPIPAGIGDGARRSNVSLRRYRNRFITYSPYRVEPVSHFRETSRRPGRRLLKFREKSGVNRRSKATFHCSHPLSISKPVLLYALSQINKYKVPTQLRQFITRKSHQLVNDPSSSRQCRS